MITDFLLNRSIIELLLIGMFIGYVIGVSLFWLVISIRDWFADTDHYPKAVRKHYPKPTPNVQGQRERNRRIKQRQPGTIAHCAKRAA